MSQPRGANFTPILSDAHNTAISLQRVDASLFKSAIVVGAVFCFTAIQIVNAISISLANMTWTLSKPVVHVAEVLMATGRELVKAITSWRLGAAESRPTS